MTTRHPAPVLTPALLAAIRARYALDWRGVHGAGHWARVRVNGLQLAARTGANPQVVELFAFLHDACRLDDGDDREHGWRAARFAASLVGTRILLPDRDVDLLLQACGGHTGGREHHSVTVLTCWDADRLDLGRVGVVPDPARLCTAAAREPATIEAAYRRSLARPRRMQKIARGASAFLKAGRR